jgi:hypothetical protein
MSKMIWYRFAVLLSITTVAAGAVPALATEKREYIKAVYSLSLTLDPIRMNDTASLVAGELQTLSFYTGAMRSCILAL